MGKAFWGGGFGRSEKDQGLGGEKWDTTATEERGEMAVAARGPGDASPCTSAGRRRVQQRHPLGEPNQYFFFFFFFFYMGKCIAAPSAARGILAAGVWGSPSRDVRWHDPRREYPLKPHGSLLRLSAGVTARSVSLYPRPRRAWAPPITGGASPWPGSVTSPAERERGCLPLPLAAYRRVEACRVPEASTPAAACLPMAGPHASVDAAAAGLPAAALSGAIRLPLLVGLRALQGPPPSW